MILTEINNMAL